jgi:hypothetical protein
MSYHYNINKVSGFPKIRGEAQRNWYGNADPHGRLPRVAGETCNLLSDVIVIDHIVVDYQLFYSGTRKLNV